MGSGPIKPLLNPRPDCGGPLLKLFGLVFSPGGAAQRGEVLKHLGDKRMFRPQRLLGDGERTPGQRFGFCVPVLRMQQPRQAMQCRGNVGVFWTEGFLSERQCASKERLRLGVPLLFPEQHGQGVQAFGHIRVLHAKRALPDVQ